jgi:hypothetical protein
VTQVDNPYAAPRSDVFGARGAAGRVWRQGKVLCMDKTAQLPPRCVRCNAPADRKVTRKLYWHSPWWALTILAGILLFAIVTLIVRKRADVEMPLCESHARARRRTIAAAWLLALGSIAAPIVASEGARPLLAVSAFFTVLAAILIGARQASVLRPVRIDEEEVRLAGAGKPYLESLERQAA